MRKRFTTSAWGRTLSILYETSTPSFSNSRGTSVLGPTSVTRAPSLTRPKMFVRAIAGIDHARFEPLRKKLRSARGAVTQHKNIGMQRLEIARRVLKRFAL